MRSIYFSYFQVEILRAAIEYINKLESMLSAEGKMTSIMVQHQKQQQGMMPNAQDYMVRSRVSKNVNFLTNINDSQFLFYIELARNISAT